MHNNRYLTRLEVSLSAGESRSFEHLLRTNGVAVAPDVVEPDRSTAIFVAALDATTITFQNPSGASAFSVFFVRYFYSTNGTQAQIGAGLIWQGAPPASAAGQALFRIPFTYAASPVFLYSLAPGNIIAETRVVVETPFDDPAATIDLGTPGSPGALCAPSDCDPVRAGRYGTDRDYLAQVPETLRLVVTPGASTQGAGHVLFTIGG